MRKGFVPVLITIAIMGVNIAFAGDMIVGGDTIHVVQKGETLQLVGARYGVFWKTIARDNDIDITVRQPLPEGMILKLNTRRIVPKIMDEGIIINVPDRTLYFFKEGILSTFPVGLGLITRSEIADWRTPTGKFSVIRKRKDPTWRVPPSIQIENALNGKEVVDIVPPGPRNPLGKYAVETSIPGVLIHSTISPGSVYRYMSHGCIRMLPEAMERFYPMVDVDIKGEIIYEPVKAAITDDGRIFLEVRTDIYKRYKSIKDHVTNVLETKGLSGKVDWQKIEKLIQDESGVAEDVTIEKKVVQAPPEAVRSTSWAQKILGYFKLRFRNPI